MSTEIPIWMNGKIRWLSGIDKKTTCKDVVEVLLEEAGISKSEAKDFAIMERWRKVERQLDENSKILKIWSHWGNEKKEVRLCLRRIDNEVDSGRGSPVGSGYLPSLRRKRNRIRGHGKHPWAYRETLHPRRLAELGRFDKKDYDDYPHIRSKQSELINDYEALNNTNAYDNKIYYDKDSENINGKLSEHKSYHCSGTGRLHSTPISVSTENHSRRQNCCSKRESKQRIRNSENIEKLMKLILAQGATIQSQLQKLKEREEQIELLEHERHRERVEKNGRNYLLETYLGSLKDAEIPEEPKDEGDNQMERTRCTDESNSYGPRKIYAKSNWKIHSRQGREDQDFSSKPQHKSTRSKSESRTQKCNNERNLKRTFSDNALAEASGTIEENECSKEEDFTQELSRQNTKEESDEIVELRKIQSQIEMWEKVFKINKKLEKEEENLVRLHIKIKKVQSENYKIVKDKMEDMDKEKDAETLSPDEKNGQESEDPEKMQYEHDCSELEKNLETLKSDLEHNSKEIYKNFTKLIEEDEIVEQKRSCLSKIMTDLERTNHEHEMLNEMIAMSESQNCQDQIKSFCEQPSDFETTNACGSFGEGLPVQTTAEPEISSENLCLNEASLPERAQENVNQRTETNTDEVSLPMKPKIVKISFEDKIQNYESSESLQYKGPYKEPTPVPTGALKSILKNRKNSFNKICNLNNECQKLSQTDEPNEVLQKNNVNDCYADNYYVNPCNVPDQINSSYTYAIPYPLYVNYPNERNTSENLKGVCLLKNPQPQEITRSSFPHGAMITTKAVVHNDTDSSTSSDTSGLSSMYSSSTNVEEPYAEKSYVLDTLV